MNTLPKMPQNKENQTMKFGQLIEYDSRKTFKNHADNEAARNLFLVRASFCFFKKFYMSWKQVLRSLVSISCDSP